MAKTSRQPDPFARLAKLEHLVRRLMVRDLPGGAAVVTPPYAIQVKHYSGDITVPDKTDTEISFDGVYFENKNGVMWPAAADSMWLDASGAPARIGAPVEGLYGFRVGYRYAVPGIPAGAFARTLVRMNGSTPVGAADHPTPTPSVGNASHIPEGTHCSLTGTTYMGVGDWLDVWAWQESGSSLTISGTGLKDDRVTTGVVFSVWLIAARQA